MFCATKEVTLVHKFHLAPNTTTYLILKEEYARIHRLSNCNKNNNKKWLVKYVYFSLTK